MSTIVRAQIAHTPRNPFVGHPALEVFEDGGLGFEDGRILFCGPFAEGQSRHPAAEVVDARDAILLPGFVDCHVHFPQIGIIGAMGLGLLEWLRERSLPEEARLADEGYAAWAADRFVRGLVANGTTTALVFGSHFVGAQEALFAAASAAGLRIASGLVLSDRNLLPELHLDPETAYRASSDLISRWHRRGLIRYTVTPRFSVSCSEGMLEACGALFADAEGLLFTSHLNETTDEIALVTELFPWARDYLETYERYRLVGPRSILAHDVHPTYRLGPAELLYLATAAGAAALGLGEEVGDLSPGKSADFVLLRPLERSTLEAVLERTEGLEDKLGPLFTLAREESVAEVRVGGSVVWRA